MNQVHRLSRHPLPPSSRVQHKKNSAGKDRNSPLPWIVGALAIATTVAVAFCQLHNSASNPPCQVSSNFTLPQTTAEERSAYCKKFVASITEMDGVPLSKMDDLAKKYSLLDNRKLTNQLFQDCLAEQGMGMSNKEIAAHLTAIFQPNGIPYNLALIPNNTINKCSRIPSSLVDPLDGLRSCCTPGGKNIFNETLTNCNECLKNTKNNISICMPTSNLQERIERIRKYGFFDELDPIKIGAFLTGHRVDEIKQMIGIDMQNDEINESLSAIVVDKFGENHRFAC